MYRLLLLKKAIRLITGLLLVLLGLMGILLPIMPGWIFLIPGLVILAEYFPPVRRLLHWAKGRLERGQSAGP